MSNSLDPMDYSPPGSSIHGILQARILEWVAVSFSKRRDRVYTGCITSWQTDGEKMETVTDFIFLGSKITVDGDCSHEIERHLLLGRKAMTNLESILKSRDITLLTKVRTVKAMVFWGVMCAFESWTMKKAECQRTDAFELWCWRRPLRVPWIAGNQTTQSWRKSTLNIHWKY